MYAVHELLSPGDTPTSCATADRHLNEAPGRDLRPDQDGLWLNLLDQPASTSTARSSSLQVSAGSILHRVPTVGYSFSFPPSARPLPSTYAPALKAHGLPMSLLGGLIQTGQPISLPDGTKLTHPGWLEGPRIAVLGDTSDASGMASLAQDVDLCVLWAIATCTSAADPDVSLSTVPDSFTRPPTHICPSRRTTPPTSWRRLRRLASSRPDAATRRPM